MERYRKSTLVHLQNAKNSPDSVVERIMSTVLYGSDYPYAEKWDREEAIKSMTIADLKAYHQTWIRLDNATLFIVSDTTMFQKYYYPDALTWVLVGDISLFQQKIRDLNIGDVEIWNAEGKKIR